MFSPGHEGVARQELDALNVDPRELRAISAICGAEQRSPERRVIGPPGAKMRVNVLSDQVDRSDWKRDQVFDDRFVKT